MRRLSLLGATTVFLLAALLAGTTPHGTGVGAHRLHLLHPLFPHGHTDEAHGRVSYLTNASTPVYEDHQEHPSFSVGTGASPAAWGLGPTPLTQAPTWLEAAPSRPWRHPTPELLPPVGRSERPPVPPPTPAA